MNRRGFLGLIGAAGAIATMDPERLLWVPGQKTIFIPPATSYKWVQIHGAMSMSFGKVIHGVSINGDTFHLPDPVMLGPGETVKIVHDGTFGSFMLVKAAGHIEKGALAVWDDKGIVRQADPEDMLNPMKWAGFHV